MNFWRIFNMMGGGSRYGNPGTYMVRRIISRVVGLVMTVVVFGAIFLFSRGCS